MSRKGDCCDNAQMESFFHSLKTERVHDLVYATGDEARRDLFQYIELRGRPGADGLPSKNPSADAFARG